MELHLGEDTKEVRRSLKHLMLLWVYEEAQKVNDAFVAVSRNTPKTRELCLREGIPFVETPGKG